MLSLRPTSNALQRPQAVAAIAGLLALLALTSLLFAVLVVTTSVPLSAGSVLLEGGLEQSGPLVFVLQAAIAALLALGLWRRWRWMRRLTIVFAAIGIALAVPAISSAVVDGRITAMIREALQIMVRVVVIYSLSQEPPREWFASART